MKTIRSVLAGQVNDYGRLADKFGLRAGQPLTGDPVAARTLDDPPAGLGSVSVIVPTWNSRATVQATLRAIERSSAVRGGADVDVVVIDDGSSDGTYEALCAFRTSMALTLIRQAHAGQSAALNTGIAHSRGDILVFCDSDVLPVPNAITELALRVAEFGTEIVAFGFRKDVDPGDRLFRDVLDPDQAITTGQAIRHDIRTTFEYPGWPASMYGISDGLRTMRGTSRLWMSNDDYWDLPKMVAGFLFAATRSSVVAVGGFEDVCQHGWGYNDSLLAARLLAFGEGFAVPVTTASAFHSGHPPRTGGQKGDERRNRLAYDAMLDAPGGLIRKVTNPARVEAVHQVAATPDGDPAPWVVRPAAGAEAVSCLVGLGRYREAIDVPLDGQDPAGLVSRAEALWRLGERERSLDLLEDLPPDLPRRAYVRAICLAELGRVPEASEAIGQALAGGCREAEFCLDSGADRHLQRAATYLYQGLGAAAREGLAAAAITGAAAQAEALTAMIPEEP